MIVRYISYGKHRYHAVIASAHEDGCELLVQARCYCCNVSGKAPERVTLIHRATYDSTGQKPHSWRVKEVS